VQVVAVNTTAETVDIHPLVNMVDGYGNATPHGVIYGCPYFRLQAGNSAIVIDPVAGDIGIALFADRDISAVIATHAQANPGSSRAFDMADGIYLGGVLNPAPTQYIRFDSAGITITSPVAVTVNAPVATINASTSATIAAPIVTVNAATSVTVTSPSITLSASGGAVQGLLNASLLTWLNSHVHGNGNAGANTTGPTTAPAATVQTSVVTAQ